MPENGSPPCPSVQSEGSETIAIRPGAVGAEAQALPPRPRIAPSISTSTKTSECGVGMLLIVSTASIFGLESPESKRGGVRCLQSVHWAAVES